MRVIRLPDPQATEAFGAMLAERVRPGDVVTLEGTLGAGKTSVARDREDLRASPAMGVEKGGGAGRRGHIGHRDLQASGTPTVKLRVPSGSIVRLRRSASGQ